MPADRTSAFRPERQAAWPRKGIAVALVMAASLGSLAAAEPLRQVSGSADGGGGHSQGARFAIEGSIGQPDAGRLASERFAIDGGFWHTPAPQTPNLPDSIFSTSFED